MSRVHAEPMRVRVTGRAARIARAHGGAVTVDLKFVLG